MRNPVVLFALGMMLGAAAGVAGNHFVEARRLTDERAARAVDAKRHSDVLAEMSAAALRAEQRAIEAHHAAASRVAQVDAKLTKERIEHESEARGLRAALAAGTERLRVAVRNCSTVTDGMPGAAGAPGVGDGATAVADLDGAVAESVFAIAEDDQHEIDKLSALQGYVCAVRPRTNGCIGD